jgi:hypothetical protein
VHQELGAAAASALAGGGCQAERNAARCRRVDGGADGAEPARCAEAVPRLLERIGTNAEARRHTDRLQRQPHRRRGQRFAAGEPQLLGTASRAEAVEGDPAPVGRRDFGRHDAAGADLPTVGCESLLVANEKLVAAVELAPIEGRRQSVLQLEAQAGGRSCPHQRVFERLLDEAAERDLTTDERIVRSRGDFCSSAQHLFCSTETGGKVTIESQARHGQPANQHAGARRDEQSPEQLGRTHLSVRSRHHRPLRH